MLKIWFKSAPWCKSYFISTVSKNFWCILYFCCRKNAIYMINKAIKSPQLSVFLFILGQKCQQWRQKKPNCLEPSACIVPIADAFVSERCFIILKLNEGLIHYWIDSFSDRWKHFSEFLTCSTFLLKHILNKRWMEIRPEYYRTISNDFVIIWTNEITFTRENEFKPMF